MINFDLICTIEIQLSDELVRSEQRSGSETNSIRQNVEKSHPPKLGYSRRFYCTKNNESKSICLCQTHIELSIKERTYDELKLLWSVDIDNHDIIIYHKYRENHMETTCQTIED